MSRPLFTLESLGLAMGHVYVRQAQADKRRAALEDTFPDPIALPNLPELQAEAVTESEAAHKLVTAVSDAVWDYLTVTYGTHADTCVVEEEDGYPRELPCRCRSLAWQEVCDTASYFRHVNTCDDADHRACYA